MPVTLTKDVPHRWHGRTCGCSFCFPTHLRTRPVYLNPFVKIHVGKPLVVIPPGILERVPTPHGRTVNR